MKLRVVLADDNPKFLVELISILSSEFDIVATAADGSSALECILRWQPDVAVLDLRMPTLNGLEITRKVKSAPSATAIVICSIESDGDIVEAVRQAGALSYVFKPRVSEDLIEAMKSAARGQSFVSPGQ
jgi:DNA-binding NarL/FixJ family response regulator